MINEYLLFEKLKEKINKDKSSLIWIELITLKDIKSLKRH